MPCFGIHRSLFIAYNKTWSVRPHILIKFKLINKESRDKFSGFKFFLKLDQVNPYIFGKISGSWHLSSQHMYQSDYFDK